MSKQEESVARTRRRRSEKKPTKKEARKQQKEQEVLKKKPEVVKVSQEPKERRRYKGYDVEAVVEKHPQKEGGWFWKVMLISLALSLVILLAMICSFLFFGKKQTDYISQINKSNTLESLLEGKTNLQVTMTYANALDGSDYTTVRQIREKEDGSYFSYYKTEGMVSDYKEVIADQEVYRNDGSYTYYYAMVDGEYEQKLQEISEDLFRVYENEKIKEQTENTDTVTIITEYEVQPGDKYTKVYGYDAGETIQREIMMDKATSQVISEKEMHKGEMIATYTLEVNVDQKVPKFYSELKKKKQTRKCSIYFDYKGNAQKSYSYDVPEDVYFAVFAQDGYTVYLDKEQEKEFTQYEMQMQNLDSVMTLYMVANKGE